MATLGTSAIQRIEASDSVASFVGGPVFIGSRPLRNSEGVQLLDVMFHAVPYALNPILFALGAAALLVSQEKEQRTLLWYSSLPIAPRTIVQSRSLLDSWVFALVG